MRRVREFPAWAGDPDAPSSRFTRLPALAIVPDEATEIAVHNKVGTDAPREVAAEVLGADILADDEVLGTPDAVDGSSGHGAEMWAVVLVWAGAGIVGGATWDLTKAIAGRLRERVSRVRSRGFTQQVSAGGARLLAIDYVVSNYPDETGPLDTEFVEEPSRLSGGALATMSYAAEEPWIVVLVSASLSFRYTIVVMPDGTISNGMRVPLTRAERVMGVNVEIPGGTEHERRTARDQANLPTSY